MKAEKSKVQQANLCLLRKWLLLVYFFVDAIYTFDVSVHFLLLSFVYFL